MKFSIDYLDPHDGNEPLVVRQPAVPTRPSTDGFKNEVVACSDSMLQIFRQAEQIARSSAPVLITGESGTGKEVVARLIHRASPRASCQYIRVNCAALSEALIESELFGHERGAFTGAVENRVGRFEGADGGSLLLDEISEIPVRLQAKLLRILEEEEFQRVGSNETRAVNARIIATSNRKLDQEVAEGSFREDLFYRLNVLQLDIPPLRHRRDDILLLAECFLEQFRNEEQCIARRFRKDAIERLIEYDWPGNVRQLRNVVRRVCILAPSHTIRARDLPELPDQAGATETPDIFRMRLRDAEKLLIQHSLRRNKGNRTAAARDLGVSARTLHNRLKQDPFLDQ